MEAIGPYRLLERLGSGGMGEVYLARERGGQMVAVKTIRPDLADREDLRVRLRREVETLRRVRSARVVEIIGADTESAVPYLALRYVEGRTLGEVVEENGPLRGEPLWAVARGLAEALSAVHTAGCLHRDLKPGNVMLVEGQPVVIDFGIAHAIGATRLTRQGYATGTPGYMSPELIAGGDAAPSADVFSWGATVAYAGTSRKADWPHMTPGAIDLMLRESSGIPAGLRDCVRAALAHDPDDRPTVPELVEQLAELEPRRGKDVTVRMAWSSPGVGRDLLLPDGRILPGRVPDGLRPGDRFVVRGEGEDGAHGAEPGDVVVAVVDPVKRHRRGRNRRGRNRLAVLIVLCAMLAAAGWVAVPMVVKSGPPPKVTLFLCTRTASSAACGHQDSTPAQRADLTAEIKALPHMVTWNYETREQAYERLKRLFADSPGFVAATRPGDIPDNFQITLRTNTDAAAVRTQLANRPGVDQAAVDPHHVCVLGWCRIQDP